MPLTLRRTWPGEIDPGTGELKQDWEVLKDDKPIGRIYRTERHQEEWFWGTYSGFGFRTESGRVGSFEEAKAAFRRAIARTKKPAG